VLVRPEERTDERFEPSLDRVTVRRWTVEDDDHATSARCHPEDESRIFRVASPELDASVRGG
jgi:hypothetical protein